MDDDGETLMAAMMHTLMKYCIVFYFLDCSSHQLLVCLPCWVRRMSVINKIHRIL